MGTGRVILQEGLHERTKGQAVATKPLLESSYKQATINRYGVGLHSKERQKDIVRDVMLELGAGPRQLSRVSGLPYSIVYKRIPTISEGGRVK